MNVAILGTGNVSKTLSGRLQEKGHTVTIGSRTPADHPGAVTYREAVEASEVVLTAIPGRVLLETLDGIGADALADRVVLDLSVPFAEDMSLAYPNQCLSGLAQAKFPNAKFVKTLNTMNVSVMIDPRDVVPNATIFVSGDDPDAKGTVKGLLNDLGWVDEDIIDLGGIETAIGTEHYPLLFRATAMALGGPKFCFTVSR